MKKIKIVSLMFFISTLCNSQIDEHAKYKSIKITAIDSTTEYFVYKAIDHEKCVNDTIIMIKKIDFNNKSKIINNYNYKVLYKYHNKVLSNTPYNLQFSDNIRISEYNYPPRLILDYLEINNSNQQNSNTECLEDKSIEDFEMFLRTFINDDIFRNSRINFEETISSRKLNKKKAIKYKKEWKIYENLIINYKSLALKRDKYFNKDLNKMSFRLYGDKLNFYWIHFSFSIDDNGQWYLSGYTPI